MTDFRGIWTARAVATRARMEKIVSFMIALKVYSGLVGLSDRFS